MVVRDRQAENVSSARDERRVVECAVYREGSRYRAICLDLSLIVERPTADEATEELLNVIHGYMLDARDAGLTWDQLRRPVPAAERRHILRKVAAAAIRQYVVDARP